MYGMAEVPAWSDMVTNEFSDSAQWSPSHTTSHPGHKHILISISNGEWSLIVEITAMPIFEPHQGNNWSENLVILPRDQRCALQSFGFLATCFDKVLMGYLTHEMPS